MRRGEEKQGGEVEEMCSKRHQEKSTRKTALKRQIYSECHVSTLSQACALRYCMKFQPLQGSSPLFSTKIDTYPGASSCCYQNREGRARTKGNLHWLHHTKQ